MIEAIVLEKLKIGGFQTNSNTINLTIQNHGAGCGH